MKTLNIKSKFGNYDVIIEENLLSHLNKFINEKCIYVLIHDDKIPSEYINKIEKQINNLLIISFPSGEKSKSLIEFKRIINILQENNIKRDACIIALGGGVTGDLAGFIASVYLRGIDYIHIPTSLLAQIDSSIGGKVAINSDLAKNSIGNFYPPKFVLIDPTVLKTLPQRQFANGMAEMIKYGMIYSKNLLEKIINYDSFDKLENLIYESVKIKKYFVEEDEMDKSIRQALNFGHTYGHAYECYYNFEKYLHGEAVALGMIKATTSDDSKQILIKTLKKFNLPTVDDLDYESLLPYIKRDKKNTIDFLNMVEVNEIGKYKIIHKKI